MDLQAILKRGCIGVAPMRKVLEKALPTAAISKIIIRGVTEPLAFLVFP